MSDNKRFFYPIIASILVIVGFGMGYILHPDVDSKRASKFEEVLDALDNKYVDSIDKNKVFDQAINDMLHKLDPHSRYITARSLKEEQESMQGSFGGIGVRFQLINDTICVIKAMSNAPAFFAGVRSGDQIIAINKKPFTGKKINTDKVMGSLKGEIDTDVEVTILRNKQKKRIRIRRGEIPMETITTFCMLDNTTGYIRIDQFSVPTHDEFVMAADGLLNQGMKKMVLDLRGNPGGVMETAILIADEFLPSGDKIVSTKGRNVENEVVRAKPGGILENIKLAVLIDENSASAAEILAGAMQDNDRALLYGRRTYGKGLVQQDQILKDGSSVRMTISRYYTPSGRSIQRAYSGDYSSYMQDEERYMKGELFFEDSIPIDKRLVYKTKQGRKVFGGGGIVPDVFIPLDTTGSSLVLTQLNMEQVFSAFVFKSLQQNRGRWNSINALVAYEIPPSEWKLFISFCKQNYHISYVESLSAAQKKSIQKRLKVEYARQLWDEQGVFQVMRAEDKELNAALKKLN